MKKLIAMTMLLALAGSLLAELVVTPNGMAQYRLRLKIASTSFDDTTSATSALNYRNQIAYYLGMGVKVNDVVSLGFQVGNNAINTEEVAFLQQKTTVTWISQAWAKMDAGVINLTFGVLPITGNGTLDLIDRSLNNASGTYAKAAQVSWPVGTNASLEGIKLGVPVLKDKFKLGVEVTHSVITNRTQAEAPEPVANPPASMFIVNLPMSVAALTVNPEIVAIINREFNTVVEKGDPELGFGLSAGYKINDMLSLTAKGAIAMRGNANSADTLNPVLHDYMGMLGAIGGVLALGPGKLMLDIAGSSNEDKEADDSQTQYAFVDLKYAFCMLPDAKKNITFMPRVRLFMDMLSDRTKTEIWPELIVIGKF